MILTGRVHPGESNSSFVMEGLLQFLLSEDSVAKTLRDRFVFKIVPMLNPDGVIVGNYRCSLSSHDLNRQYPNPSSKLFPECFAVKQMIRKTLECRKIELYCDFHGHSRQKDIFMYGCSQVIPGQLQSDKQLRERVFPMMYDQVCSNASYAGSAFSVTKSKESTGRVVMWREFSLNNSYTCEASFCGPSQGICKGFHFSIKMLLDMGRDFCRTLALYSEVDASYYKQILTEIQYDFNKAQGETATRGHDGQDGAQGTEKGGRFGGKSGQGKASKASKAGAGKDKGGFGNDHLKGLLSVTSKS